MKEKLVGIYLIKNKSNLKVYVGQSVDIEKRFITHKNLLKNNKHFNKYLQSSWNKYGEENFVFEVSQFCLSEQLTWQEQATKDHFAKMAGVYNFGKCVSPSMKGMTHSEEAKQKMSEFHKEHQNKPEVKQKKSKFQKEHQNRPEVKEKMSEFQKEHQNRPEVKQKKSEFQKEHQNKQEVKEKNREFQNRPEVKEKNRKKNREANKYKMKSVKRIDPATRGN